MKHNKQMLALTLSSSNHHISYLLLSIVPNVSIVFIFAFSTFNFQLSTFNFQLSTFNF
jgi:hypothetical protein